VTTQAPIPVIDFYTDLVLPALAERLDHAFPEFGWRRDSRGWVATNEEHTHARLGVRAQRVVAHGPAPRGFLVHGGDPMLWPTYLSSGLAPRGEEFVRAVEELARRAGVDPTPIERAAPRDRRADLLRDFFELCRRELMHERGAKARAYLERRGLPSDAIERAGLGLVPSPRIAKDVLGRAGYRRAEIDAAGVLADSRWPGRVCGAWRRENGRPGTLWARACDGSERAETRYLYLRGATRSTLPPYGLAEILAGPHRVRRDIVLVEGVFDLHQLRSHGVENIAALGGLGTAPRTFELLSRVGVERATLCFDCDEPGRTATARAIEHSTRARYSPTVLVLDPEHLAPAKDPDALVRDHGVRAWHAALATRECAIAWRAVELLGGATIESHLDERRDGLSRAGSWLGTLPPRLAVEQEDAVRTVAERCGYSALATERAFRARFWRAPAIDLGCGP
jgi:DNA primase